MSAGRSASRATALLRRSPGLALIAAPAAVDEDADADVIAHTELGDVGPNGLDDAGALVPGRHATFIVHVLAAGGSVSEHGERPHARRKLNSLPFAADLVQVAVADTRVVDGHLDVAGAERAAHDLRNDTATATHGRNVSSYS